MGCGNAFYALVAPPRARVIGGMESVILDQPFYYKLIVGSLILEMNTLENAWTLWKTHSDFIVVTQ